MRADDSRSTATCYLPSSPTLASANPSPMEGEKGKADRREGKGGVTDWGVGDLTSGGCGTVQTPYLDRRQRRNPGKDGKEQKGREGHGKNWSDGEQRRVRERDERRREGWENKWKP